MMKILTLFSTSDGMTPEEFRRYWADHYQKDILKEAVARFGVRRIVHNHTIDLSLREDAGFGSGIWAGVSEIWFDIRQDADNYLSSDLVCEINEAHSKQLTRTTSLICEEKFIWNEPGITPSLKMWAFFHPSAAMDRAECQRYWTDEHVKVGRSLIDSTLYSHRYAQNHVCMDFHADDEALDYAGAAELWFRSPDLAQRMFYDFADINELREDEARFTDQSRVNALMTDELEIYIAKPDAIKT